MRHTPLNRRSKTPKCKECKQKFTPLSSELFCSDNCRDSFAQKAIAKANKNREKAIKKARAESKREIKAMAERAKTHGEWENDLEDKIRYIVRLIDGKSPCISCGNSTSGLPYHAGHFYTKGHNNGLRYNLIQIFRQCNQCNTHLSSNRTGYEKGIVMYFGERLLEEVKFDIVRLYPFIKMSIPEMKEKIQICNGIIKELKRGAREYSLEERISLRRKYNEQIGIYTIQP